MLAYYHTRTCCPTVIEIYVKCEDLFDFNNFEQHNFPHKHFDEWTKIRTITRRPVMYMEKFVCSDHENILFNSETVTYLSSSCDLNYFLNGPLVENKKNYYCGRRDNTEYKLIQKRINNEKVYVYGSFDTHGMFNCKVMGPVVSDVVDRIYSAEHTAVTLLGTINVALLALIVYRSFSK